jgi:hypothetical protein
VTARASAKATKSATAETVSRARVGDVVTAMLGKMPGSIKPGSLVTLSIVARGERGGAYHLRSVNLRLED